MPKRILVAVVFIALAAQLVLAQQPQLQRQKVAPPAKPKVKTAVTVIDLRNVTADKKPPKRAADPVYSMRMASGPKTTAVAALPAAQLSEALKGAGISVVPANVYARFTPGQLNVPGKGYLLLAAPYWSYPDRAEFYSSYSGSSPWIWNGPKVVLREPGTYVFDFLVDYAGAPVGSFYECEVSVGFLGYQVQAIMRTADPQHILVIWPVDQAMISLSDEQRSIGIHCYRSDSRDQLEPWTLYLVDVTKL